MSLHNSPKISIIVPVYNAEKYLHRCIDSLLNQTFTDFEVLLINDGSTDLSGAICHEYAKKDKRVRVFYKENGGVSSARNVGLKNMRGEYSIHCDSDDWVEKNMYEELYFTAVRTKSDVVICDFYSEIFSGSSLRITQKPKLYLGSYIIKDMLCGRLHGSTWNKLVKNSIIYDNNISFESEVNYCEDLLFNVRIFKEADKIAYSSGAYYHYCYNPMSIMRGGLTEDKAFSLIKFINLLHEYLDLSFKPELSKRTLQVKISLLNSRRFSYDFIRNFYKEYNKDYKYSGLHIYYKTLFFLLINRCYILLNVLHSIQLFRAKLKNLIYSKKMYIIRRRKRN